MIGLCKRGNLELVCEALNAIFDIYGDERYDEVLAKRGGVAALSAGVGVLSGRLKKAKAEGYSALARQHFRETLGNLKRFVAYKEQLNNK